MFDCVFIFISYTMKSALKKKAYKIEFIEFHTRCTCKIITECHFNRRNEIIPNSQGILPKKEIFQKWQYSNRVIQAELEDRPKSYSCSDQGYVWQIFPQTTSTDEVDTVCYMVKWRWKKRTIILSGVSLKHTQNNLKSFFFHFSVWSIVDLQCCDHFCSTTKWFSCTCTHIHSLPDSFHTWIITEYWVEFSVLDNRSRLASHSRDLSVHMPIPNPRSISPPPNCLLW